MVPGASGLIGPIAVQLATVGKHRGPDFVILHSQLMVEVNVQEMATKRSHAMQMRVQVRSDSSASLS